MEHKNTKSYILKNHPIIQNYKLRNLYLLIRTLIFSFYDFRIFLPKGFFSEISDTEYHQQIKILGDYIIIIKNKRTKQK